MSNQSRAAESRSATTRRAIGGQPRGRLEVDLTGLPDDMEACFIREYTLGERDDNNIQDAFDRGFTPAMAEDYPNAKAHLLPGDEDKTHGVIRRGGQVLMIRPKSIGREEREYQRQEVQSQKNAAIKLSESSDANFDKTNFAEDDGNKVTERASAGKATRPAGKPGSRFADA